MTWSPCSDRHSRSCNKTMQTSSSICHYLLLLVGISLAFGEFEHKEDSVGFAEGSAFMLLV